MKDKNITYNNQTAVINLPHHKYADRVLRSNSYEELFWRFKDAESPIKEVTESYAALSNLKKICIISNANWLHIGDGAHTRTAAIFAFFSKENNNFSIDPALNIEKFDAWQKRYNVSGIIPVKKKFQDFSHRDMCELLNTSFIPTYNICCVHAHVKVEEVDKQFPYWTYFYTNICCLPAQQSFSEAYMKEHNIVEILRKQDMGILSHQREVIIYKKLKGNNPHE